MPRQPGSDRWANDDLLTHTDWCDVYGRVNDLIENPDSGCPTVVPLECPEAPHIWTKTDITEVRDKLDEICEDNITTWTDYEEDQLWSAELLNEVESAIEQGWCNCCWDCPNAKPPDYNPNDEPYTDMGTHTLGKEVGWTDDLGHVDQVYLVPDGFVDGSRTTYDNVYYDPTDPDGQAALRATLTVTIDETYDAVRDANDDWFDYATIAAGWQRGVDIAQGELDDAEAILVELEQIRDEICAEAVTDPSRQEACDEANQAVADQEAEIVVITAQKALIDAEFARLTAEADSAWSAMEAAVSANTAALAAYPPMPGGINYSNLIPSVTPLTDLWDPDQVAYTCGGDQSDLAWWVGIIGDDAFWCWSPQPTKCRTSWQLGYKSNFSVPIDPNYWLDLISGSYAPNGIPYQGVPMVWGWNSWFEWRSEEAQCGYWSALAGACIRHEYYTYNEYEVKVNTAVYQEGYFRNFGWRERNFIEQECPDE